MKIVFPTDKVTLIVLGLLLFIFGLQFGRAKKPEPQIPVIITVRDTVETIPQWLKDSLKKLSKRKATRDTHEIVVTNTLLDTVFVSVPADTAQRPPIWPLTSYQGGTKFGDTAVVTTFSLRSGKGSVSKVFIPGILTGIQVDSSPIPKLIYEPFPKPKGPPFLYKVKLVGIGVLSGLALRALLN